MTVDTRGSETLRSDRPITSASGSAPGWGHLLIRVGSCHRTEFIDITGRLDQLISATGIAAGILNIQTLHTTTALIVNEHEPLLLADFERALDNAAPAHGLYHHDDLTKRTVNVTPDERVNGHAHCRALLLPTTICLNIVDGRLLLGQWQRVFLVELDGPRERCLSVMIVGVADKRLPLLRVHSTGVGL
ncbi:MAG: secondary thiamine-phosphate synthase enzyme [Blastocatellia bacterium]|nr:MAG: secondary thiamine-phosphate synthase enzyme [Blastocatellia bacterium]